MGATPLFFNFELNGSSICQITQNNILMRLHVANEYGRLKKVLMAPVGNFYLHEPINSAQEYYYRHDPPLNEKLVEQQGYFAKTLEENGVEVVWARGLDSSPNQVNTRDIAFVIGETLVVSSLKEKIRREEVNALSDLCKEVSTPVLRAEKGVIEGGDVILDNGIIYTGISSRTDYDGVKWLERNFSENYTIVPVELKPGFLHLDVVFNIVGPNTAIVYREGIKNTDVLSSRYELIKVDASEQATLATNTLTISSGTVIVEKRNARVAKVLNSLGNHVISLDYSEVAKIGGSFRCSTCPLMRI